MDVDNIDADFDGKFFDLFRSMGTTDKDELIAEFQAVIGNNINKEQGIFFLEMNNWNLQNAVCSYYDLQQPAQSFPSVSIAECLSLPIQTLPPNSLFSRKYMLKNTGTERWPPGCHMQLVGGSAAAGGQDERRMVPEGALTAGQEAEVRLELRAPPTPGPATWTWRMTTPTGLKFGDPIHISINVEGASSDMQNEDGCAETSISNAVDDVEMS